MPRKKPTDQSGTTILSPSSERGTRKIDVMHAHVSYKAQAGVCMLRYYVVEDRHPGSAED